ncbi:hypothetical protein HOI18_00240 [Candidatus Uhrbacteria bacterium]|jgi:hypothetical protein|nr:hypothetical protein [Candidatus Uhrbacteria bacterium]
MNKEDIAVGMVVRLIPGEGEFCDYLLRDKIGEIAFIDLDRGERCLGVKMGAGFRARETRVVDGVGWFAYDEVSVMEAGWTPKLRATHLFGRGYHHSSLLVAEWTPERLCMHAAHDGADPPNSTKRIMINAWGTVCDVDVCPEHERLDGFRMDMFPWGERWRKKLDVGA